MDAAAIRALPKAELHLHIEGTLEPEMMFQLAARNGVQLRYSSVDELRAAYVFEDLQSFLDLYYEGCAVLRTEQDFSDLTCAYLERAHADGVERAEIFFDPQTHTARGIPFEVVVDGITDALDRGRRELGISSGLILCFLRDRGAEAALTTWKNAASRRDRLLGVGLDSAEMGHPPADFAPVFREAADAGLHRVAHAGEEGPPEYITQALDLLGAERIDHGVRCLEDDRLVERLASSGTPLTVCPLSNVRLRVVDRIEDHPLQRLLDRGVHATVNSDDPAYFGGYIGGNFEAAARGLHLSDSAIAQLAANSLRAAFS